MPGSMITVPTSNGKMDCYMVQAPAPSTAPVIILFMDALGVRPVLMEIAERLSVEGYTVCLPNFYYRHGEVPPINVHMAFQPGPEQDRMLSYYASLTTGQVMGDLRDLLAHHAADTPIACLGYCMGGAFALSAAGLLGEQVRAVASIHGGGLVTEAIDSPHRSLSAIKAKLYLGFAGIDPYFPPDDAGAIVAAAYAAEIDHIAETYAGVHHGFAIADTPAFDAAAAARHWDRVVQLFGEAFLSYRPRSRS